MSSPREQFSSPQRWTPNGALPSPGIFAFPCIKRCTFSHTRGLPVLAVGTLVPAGKSGHPHGARSRGSSWLLWALGVGWVEQPSSAAAALPRHCHTRRAHQSVHQPDHEGAFSHTNPQQRHTHRIFPSAPLLTKQQQGLAKTMGFRVASGRFLAFQWLRSGAVITSLPS